MTNDEFIKLMQFPSEWVEWDMLPDELLNVQLAHYESGGERASEQYRSRAFYFWLSRRPSKEVLLKLAILSFLDPDPLTGYRLRTDYIAKAENADDEVSQALRQGRL